MKLSILHETLGTGAIAMRPVALGNGVTVKSPNKGSSSDKRWYLKFAKTPRGYLQEDGESSKSKLPSGKSRQPPTNVWQFYKPKQQKRWYGKYAATHDPDERLLQTFRGKGY